MTRTETYTVVAEPAPPAPPKWKRVFSKEYPEAKTYKGKCTHEDVAFLVDPLKILIGWERWAKEDLPGEIEAQYEAQGTVPLKLKVYVGTEKVFFGLIDYPAVRVESWHHGSPGIVLVLALILGIIIAIGIIAYFLFKKAEELDWVVPVVAGGLIVVGLLLALMLVPKRRD